MEFQIWSDLCQKMLKNGLDYDFCENGSKDFAYMVSWHEADCILSIEGGPMFWKNMELVLRIDSG